MSASSPPPSPGDPPPSAHFADQLATLLRSFLQTSSLSTPLSPSFRDALLIDESWHEFDTSIGLAHSHSKASVLRFQQSSEAVEEGVPPYPLYKYLAYALCAWMEIGAFPRRIEPMPGLSEDHSWKEKLQHWSPTVIQLVTLLKELMRSVKFQLHVQEPFFSQLQDGSKTVEGRCAVGDYSRCFTAILMHNCKESNIVITSSL